MLYKLWALPALWGIASIFLCKWKFMARAAITCRIAITCYWPPLPVQRTSLDPIVTLENTWALWLWDTLMSQHCPTLKSQSGARNIPLKAFPCLSWYKRVNLIILNWAVWTNAALLLHLSKVMYWWLENSYCDNYYCLQKFGIWSERNGKWL